jgi:hypothetical protein
VSGVVSPCVSCKGNSSGRKPSWSGGVMLGAESGSPESPVETPAADEVQARRPEGSQTTAFAGAKRASGERAPRCLVVVHSDSVGVAQMAPAL